MKKPAITNPGYEALQEERPETMAPHRQNIVHVLTLNTLRHYKPATTEVPVQNAAEATVSYSRDAVGFQQPAIISPETQAQVLELSEQRDTNDLADKRQAVDLVFENPLYDQKAA